MSSRHTSIVSTKIGHSIIVTLGADLSESVLADIKKIALEDIHQHSAQAVIFELSALQFIDTFEFEELKKIVRMVEMLGADAFFTGLRSGIVMYLIENDVNIDGIQAFFGLDEAIRHIENLQQPQHD